MKEFKNWSRHCYNLYAKTQAAHNFHQKSFIIETKISQHIFIRFFSPINYKMCSIHHLPNKKNYRCDSTRARTQNHSKKRCFFRLKHFFLSHIVIGIKSSFFENVCSLTIIWIIWTIVLCTITNNNTATLIQKCNQCAILLNRLEIKAKWKSCIFWKTGEKLLIECLCRCGSRFVCIFDH